MLVKQDEIARQEKVNIAPPSVIFSSHEKLIWNILIVKK